MVLIDLTQFADIFNYGFLILSGLIWILGLYKYFKKEEKDRTEFLITLTFLFFFIAGLAAVPFLNFLNNDVLKPWNGTFLLFAGISAFIAAKPWKAF